MLLEQCFCRTGLTKLKITTLGGYITNNLKDMVGKGRKTAENSHLYGCCS